MFLHFCLLTSLQNNKPKIIFSYPKIENTDEILNDNDGYIKSELPFTFIIKMKYPINIESIELKISEWFCDFPKRIIVSGFHNEWEQIIKLDGRRTRVVQKFKVKCDFVTKFFKFDVLEGIGNHGFVCINQIKIFGKDDSMYLIKPFHRKDYIENIVRRLHYLRRIVLILFTIIISGLVFLLCLYVKSIYK